MPACGDASTGENFGIESNSLAIRRDHMGVREQ
jgi:hypothetical protein